MAGREPNRCTHVRSCSTVAARWARNARPSQLPERRRSASRSDTQPRSSEFAAAWIRRAGCSLSLCITCVQQRKRSHITMSMASAASTARLLNQQPRQQRAGRRSLRVQAAGSTFGHSFRVTTFGESHGGGVGCVIDGVPPRLHITQVQWRQWQQRRRKRRPPQAFVFPGSRQGRRTAWRVLPRLQDCCSLGAAPPGPASPRRACLLHVATCARAPSRAPSRGPPPAGGDPIRAGPPAAGAEQDHHAAQGDRHVRDPVGHGSRRRHHAGLPHLCAGAQQGPEEPGLQRDGGGVPPLSRGWACAAAARGPHCCRPASPPHVAPDATRRHVRPGGARARFILLRQRLRSAPLRVEGFFVLHAPCMLPLPSRCSIGL